MNRKQHFNRSHSKPEILRTGRYIQQIVDEIPCEKHGAELGIPCWYIHQAGPNEHTLAICRTRILRAGYNGVISPSSLRQKASRPKPRP